MTVESTCVFSMTLLRTIHCLSVHDAIPYFSVFPSKKRTYLHTQTNTIVYNDKNGTNKTEKACNGYPSIQQKIALGLGLSLWSLFLITVKTFPRCMWAPLCSLSYISHNLCSTLLSDFGCYSTLTLSLSSLRCWVSFRFSGAFFFLIEESMAVLILLFLLAASVVAADEGDFLSFFSLLHAFFILVLWFLFFSVHSIWFWY